ncbi:amidohydrolase, partial [Mesorhizobium sp. M4B.F.Ca.ET.169.01.1.1]
MIVDTHLHLIDQAALRYPWLAGVPALNRDFSYQEYATDALRSGIEAVLHMEVDVDPADIEAETARVEGLSRQSGSMLAGVIASCRPEEG